MRAMILAAGLGTRLRPLTLVRPKVLVPLMGTSVLEFWISHLTSAGYEEIVVNAYQVQKRLVAEIREGVWPIPVQVRVEPFLLGTGGGLRNVLDLFSDEPFVVINGDIVCNAPLGPLYEKHVRSGERVSLLLHDCVPFNNVAVGEDGAILGFGEEAYALRGRSPDVKLMAFTGIHFVHPGVVRELPSGEYADIIPLYRKLIRTGSPPKALIIPNLYWREMGAVDAYWTLNRELSRLPAGFLPPLKTGNTVRIASSARVAPCARLEGLVVVGKGSNIASDCELEDVIIWDGVTVEPGSKLRGCIVADGATVRGRHEDEIIIDGCENGDQYASM